jgi:hypothetical protein
MLSGCFGLVGKLFIKRSQIILLIAAANPVDLTIKKSRGIFSRYCRYFFA